jgi:ABC-type Mn2+/Zn2+ transport system ATPase subunit
VSRLAKNSAVSVRSIKLSKKPDFFFLPSIHKQEICGGEAQAKAVDAVIADVGLTEKRNTAAIALSGGMKRKLCLAMALIGTRVHLFAGCVTT